MTRTLRGATRAARDEGVVEVSIPLFDGIDAFGTGWRPGVFDQSLAEQMPKVVGWDHDSGQRFGVVKDWRRTDDGYLFTAQLNLDTAAGRDAFSTLKFDLENKSPDDWSFRFEPHEIENDDDGIPHFVRADIHEISPVLVGAVSGTATVGARSAQIVVVGAAELARTTATTDDQDPPEAFDTPADQLAEIADGLADLSRAMDEEQDHRDFLEGRGVRIGKKFSAATLERLQAAYDALGELLAQAADSEGSADADDDDDDAGRAALAALTAYGVPEHAGAGKEPTE